MAQAIRLKCLELSHKYRASHLGGSLSVADILSVLYSGVLKFDPKDRDWADRDRLYYSKCHA
jgi:transketolase